jgi:hypothetical protein
MSWDHINECMINAHMSPIDPSAFENLWHHVPRKKKEWHILPEARPGRIIHKQYCVEGAGSCHYCHIHFTHTHHIICLIKTYNPWELVEVIDNCTCDKGKQVCGIEFCDKYVELVFGHNAKPCKTCLKCAADGLRRAGLRKLEEIGMYLQKTRQYYTQNVCSKADGEDLYS